MTALVIMAVTQTSTAASSLNGKVMDTANRPLLGVSVVLMDSTRMLTCTATNYDGHFVINMADEWPSGLALRLSLVGYQRRDIMMVKPSENEELTITLKPAVPPSSGEETPATNAARHR